MAERRAIRSRIWDDEFFGELPFLGQVVWIGLFSRCADDQGRMVDNSLLIGRQLFPYKDVPAIDIEQTLVLFGDHILRYTVNDKSYVQLVKWWDHQPLQYAVPSNYPSPENWTDRYRTTYKNRLIVFNWPGMVTTDLGTLLYETIASLGRISTWTDYVGSLVTSRVGTLNPNPNPNPNTNLNPNTLREEAPLPEKRPDIYSVYEREIGPLTPLISDELDLAEKDYSQAWVADALKESALCNHRSWKYALAILKRWKVEGKDTRSNGSGRGKKEQDEERVEKLLKGE